MTDRLPGLAALSSPELCEIQARRIPGCSPNRTVAGEKPSAGDVHIASQSGVGDPQLPERPEEVTGLDVESLIGRLGTQTLRH